MAVTENEHDALSERASVATHVTFVVPGENAEPDAGVHTDDTGAVPPEVTGAANDTAFELPVIEKLMSLEQAICGAVPVGVVGPGFSAPQPTAPRQAMAMINARTARLLAEDRPNDIDRLALRLVVRPGLDLGEQTE